MEEGFLEQGIQVLLWAWELRVKEVHRADSRGDRKQGMRVKELNFHHGLPGTNSHQRWRGSSWLVATGIQFILPLSTLQNWIALSALAHVSRLGMG